MIRRKRLILHGLNNVRGSDFANRDVRNGDF
jgi:hypothetical protein